MNRQTKIEHIYNIDYSVVIGKGSFSRIFKALDSRTNKIVAVKCVKLKKLTPQCKKLLISEISLLKSINHPNIIKCLDHFITDKMIYIILEYCPKGDLSQFLQNNHLEENEVKMYFLQLIESVKYLRDNKIMHRDIKPTNILMSSDNELKLSDFGLAKRYQKPSLLSETICGSPLYMAPELLFEKQYTNTCDVWSLGIVLYEMLFKNVPFEANTLPELKNKLIHNSLEITNISENCKDLLKRLLEKDDRRRISWEELFNHEWLSKSEQCKLGKTKSLSIPIKKKRDRNVHNHIIMNFLDDFEYEDDYELI